MMQGLILWTVYDKPLDFPDNFVARKFLNSSPTQEVLTATSLDEIRALLPLGLTRLPRMDEDDPNIVEVWL